MVDNHAQHNRSTNRRMFFSMVGNAIIRRPSRALMAILASTIGAASLLCLATICLVVPAQMSAELRSYGANLIVNAANGFTQRDVDTIHDQVSAVAPAQYAPYRYESVRVNAAPYTLAGIDADQVQALNKHWHVEGAWPSTGNIVVGRDAAEALRLEIGSTVTIAVRSDSDDEVELHNGRRSSDILQTDGQRLRVAGILDTGGAEDGLMYMDAQDLNTLAGERGPDVLEFSSEADPDALSQLTAALQASSYQAHQVTRMTSANQRIITMLQTLFWIVSVVVLVLTLVGVSTTLRSIVNNRRAEIGLRRALGASSRSVVTEYMSESVIYGLLGGMIGSAIGFILARMVCVRVFERTIAVNWALTLGCIALSTLLAVLAAVGPVKSAVAIDPAVVLREE